MEKEKVSKAKNSKVKKFWVYAGVVILILAALIIALLFYKQKIETTKLVNMTENWQTFKNQDLGISFKYPKDWEIQAGKWKIGENIVDYEISKKDNKEGKNVVYLSILNGERSIGDREPEYAIQISIPFSKLNYMIFSTSTNSNYKEIFYNIPVTLEFGK